TFAGRPWVAHEWLSEVLMALAYRVGGWSGLMLLFALAIAKLVAILGTELRRWLGPASQLAALGLAFALLEPLLLRRPHMLALPLLAVWIVGLLRAREAGRAPSLWLAPLMTLWANMHGSFVFGLALAGAFATEAVLAAGKGNRIKAALPWAGFCAAAL